MINLGKFLIVLSLWIYTYLNMFKHKTKLRRTLRTGDLLILLVMLFLMVKLNYIINTIGYFILIICIILLISLPKLLKGKK